MAAGPVRSRVTLGRRRRRAGVVTPGIAALLAAALVLVAPAGPAGGSPRLAPPVPPVALVATTTTTLPVTTTVPTTTTTSSVPVTTSSRPARTTTTTVPATTTTTTPGAPASSKTPWALIVVIVVLAVAILVVVVLLMRARRRKELEAAWRRAVVPALSDAQLARESLLSGNAASNDPELRGAVTVQADRAAIALDGAARQAPDPEAGSAATTAAGALRGLAFAIEADRLLRQGTSAPTGVQLAQADEARRARTTELNTALARLSARIGSSPGSPARR
jgi:hypothetical protein